MDIIEGSNRQEQAYRQRRQSSQTVTIVSNQGKSIVRVSSQPSVGTGKACLYCKCEKMTLEDREIGTVEVTCGHYRYHEICQEKYIKSMISLLSPIKTPVYNPSKNPCFECSVCHKAVPTNIPQWDGEAFVCKILKSELDTPLPYCGAPMTFALASDNLSITVALGFRGPPDLHTFGSSPCTTIFIPVSCENSMSKLMCTYDGPTDSTQLMDLNRSHVKHCLSYPPLWKDMIENHLLLKKTKKQKEETGISTYDQSFLTCQNAKRTFFPDSSAPYKWNDLGYVDYQVLHRIATAERQQADHPSASRQPSEITDSDPEKTFIKKFTRIDGQDNTITAIDSPMYDILWCFPANQTDTKGRSASSSTAGLISPDTTDAVRSPIPPVKWRDIARFKITVTNTNSTEIFAEIGGITFNRQEPKDISAIFHNAITSNIDYEKPECKKFKADFRTKIALIEPDGSFCIRVQLENPDELEKN